VAILVSRLEPANTRPSRSLILIGTTVDILLVATTP